MSVRAPPTVVQPAAPAGTPSLSPEERLQAQAGLADLAFGSAAFTGSRLSSTQHLAFLPPEELALDLDDPQQRELGDYTLLEKLGQGGMGVVYRARQNSLDREVAIKLLAAGPWASRDFIERFRREAQSAARMQHPNIVGIYEIGRHEELNFFSMRLVRGPSLAHRLGTEGPMAPRAVAQLLRTVAEAVDYAHRLGVLHLDLKPGNVLIDEDGVPLVADFGLARRMDESLGHDSDEVSGTPSYMAPEQAQLKSHRLSAATDIHGLGAIGFEMLCGRPPFQGITPHETLLRVVQAEAPRLRDLRHDIPADLEAIIAKCLAKAPEKRYSSARALADDLARYLDGRAVSVRTPAWHERLARWAKRDPKLAIAAAALLATLVTGVVATSLQWQRAESNAVASRRLLWEGRREAALRLEVDGKGQTAMAQLLANLAEAERHGARDDAARDRQRLGVLVGGGATLIDTAVIAGANPFAIEVSPDGTRLVVALTDLTVAWFDTATLTERGRVSLATRGTSDGQRRPPVLLRFAGNDRVRVTLEWYSNLASPNDGDTWLIDLATGAVVEPPPQFAAFADATWSADGRLALLRNASMQSQLWQAAPWRPLSALGEAPRDFQPALVDPAGRFVLELGIAMRDLLVRDPATLAATRRLRPAGDVGVSAWALSGDGRTLALGDFEGRLFLLDTLEWSLRALASSRGREITWVAFSENDAWLAATSFDGTVQAFDARTGDALVSGRMQADFAPRRVGLSHRERLLVVSGQGRASLWRLPEAGPRALPAQRIGFEPSAHALAGPQAVGWSLAQGLLATVGMDGQLRLYRLPVSALRPEYAPRQSTAFVRGGDAWLVDTEWDQLRVVSPDGHRAGPWKRFAQPPGHAVVMREDLLVATVGTQLLGLALPDLAPAFAPIDLPATPQRLVPAPDGARLVLDFGAHGAEGFEDRLQLFDVSAGRRLPGEAVLPGPARQLAWSPDGTRLVAVGPPDGATHVLDARDLRVLGEFPHDPFEPVQWASFDPGHAAVWLVTRATDRRFDGDALVRWMPGADAEHARTPLPDTRPIGVLAVTHGVLIAGIDRDLWWPAGAAAPHALPRRSKGEPLAVAAASPDGRLLARAFRHEVQLLDARTAEPIGLPLPAGAQAMDFISELGFTADGGQLRARTFIGRWMTWPVAAETRPVTTLARGLARLDADAEDQGVVRVPTAEERRALRERDPGPLAAPPERPAVALAGRAQDGSRVPARAPGTPPHVLGLDASYTNGPESVRNTFYSVMPTIRAFPGGVARIGGTDYDIRGMAQIGGFAYDTPLPGAFGGAATGTQVTGVSCLPTPAVTVDAVHLLLRLSLRTPARSGEPLARLTLHYADGTQAEALLRAGTELPGYSGRDAAVPQTFATYLPFAVFGLDPELLSSPRIPNPHPDRVLRCLDFAAIRIGAPLLLVGATLEPSAAPAALPNPRARSSP